MSDREKIETTLMKMQQNHSSVAVQTIMHIVQRWLAEDEHGEFTIPTMIVVLKFIGDASHTLACRTKNWTYKGRFSEALFDRYYLEDGQDTLGIYTDLKNTLKKLDTAYGEHFSIENAQSYLRDVALCSSMLQNDLEN